MALFEGLLINILILVIALVVLDKASDLTIDDAVRVADVTGSGKTTIGFILVAFCTSLPALSVSIFSALMITDTHTIHGWISLLKGLGYVKEVNPPKTNYSYMERRITPTPETKYEMNHAQIQVFLKQHAHHEQQVENPKERACSVTVSDTSKSDSNDAKRTPTTGALPHVESTQNSSFNHNTTT